MTTLRSKVASALSFAHLASIGNRAKAEDEYPEKKDDDKAKSKGNAEDDDPEKKDQDHDDGDSKKSKRAEDDKDDPDAEDDDPEKKDDDKAKSKSKAKAEDDDAEDDDDEEEMRGSGTAAKARRRERARCASIFGSKAAARNPVLAANLAFTTSMTRKEALAVLEGTPAAGINADRSSRNPSLGAGGVTHANSPQAVASQWDKAFSKAAPRR